MFTRTTRLLLALCALSPSFLLAAISETWGAKGFIQHPGTVSYKSLAGKPAIVFDLAKLPPKTAIHRARLFVRGSGDGFHFFPADEAGKVTGDQIKLVEPYRRWFDATAAMRSWRKAGKSKLVIICKTGFDSRRTRAELEIMYDGKPANPPKQVSGIKLLPYPGQVLITFKEIEDIAGGNDNITWGQMISKVGACTPYGMILKKKQKELIYRLYRHDKPITAENLGEAELLNELYPGSLYTDPSIPKGKVGEHGPRFLQKGNVLKRLYIGPNKQLPSGTGTYMHTYAKSGKGYYAVTTCINGVENTTSFSDQNVFGPLDEKKEVPWPMFYAQKVTKLRSPKDAEHQERWYQWWVQAPLSHMPRRIDVTVSLCPKTLSKTPSLKFTRGHAWITTPEPPGPAARSGIIISHCSDSPNVFWMGVNDGHGNLKGMRDGKWQPFPMRRQKALLEWAVKQWDVDRNCINSATGCWGMMEIEDGDLYAMCHGWGLPEVSKGFQAWGRSNIWGGPALYAERPKEENPYYRQDYGRWVREDPKRETPWFAFHMGWGAHFTEMGWPCFPRFLRGMIEAKRPFVYNSGSILSAMGSKIRLNQSLPAFGNCSLDGNPGNGDLSNGNPLGGCQLNGYLLWDTESIVDEADKWEMTVFLSKGDKRGRGKSPLPECTVDITPRRCQQFKAKPGEKFKWTNTDLASNKVVKSGEVAADQWGLVTIKQALVSQGKNRISIAR